MCLYTAQRYFLLVYLCLAISLAAPALADDLEQRTAAAHAADKPEPSPAAEAKPARRVDSRPAIYGRAAGKNLEGWLSWPAGQQPAAGSPALIVIHEWWGLNDNVRAAAERLAGEGYITLAVDLYGGGSAENPKDAMVLMQGLNSDEAAGRENLAAAYAYLANEMLAGKIGVIGWCLGGRWSLQAALRLPEDIDAAVIYYGGVTDDKTQLETLQMPILGLFAGDDPVVPVDTVAAFEKALDELDKNAEIHIYPEAKHAFANPSGLAYDAAVADDAWQRTTGFLARYLQN